MVRSPGTDWERVVGLASAQFVLPACAAALRDLDLSGLLGEELGSFLQAVHAANLERNDELRDELITVVGILNLIEIEPVLLKGAIRLADGLYPDQGWRMLRDLDLLVPEHRWEDAIRSFQQFGYTPRGEANNEISMRRAGGPVSIDLHRELFSTRRRARLLGAQEMLRDSRQASFGVATVRLPSLEHQIIHLIGHRQLQDYNYAYAHVAWRDWFEVAALESWGRLAIDWQGVLSRFVKFGYRAPLLAFLLSLESYRLCAAPVPYRSGPLLWLNHCRLRLQARSATFASLASWAVRCVSELKIQLEERDAGELRALKNLKRLVFEPGAVWRMAQALADRHRQLFMVSPHLTWLIG
jgi:hypothetical protein